MEQTKQADDRRQEQQQPGDMASYNNRSNNRDGQVEEVPEKANPDSDTNRATTKSKEATGLANGKV